MHARAFVRQRLSSGFSLGTSVYSVGSFDLFHVGHVDFLEKASQLGDYVIVGLLTDHESNKNFGYVKYDLFPLFMEEKVSNGNNEKSFEPSRTVTTTRL